MSDDDLIRRGDALYAIAGWEIPSTAIAAMPAVTVGVKPLVFTEARNHMWNAQHGYRIGWNHDDRYRVKLVDRVICKSIKGFDAAVDWANKHNEARILAALEPQPAPDALAIKPSEEFMAFLASVKPFSVGDGMAAQIRMYAQASSPQPAPDAAAIREAWEKAYWQMRSYAVHDNDCKLNKPPRFDGPCSCGLTAALEDALAMLTEKPPTEYERKVAQMKEDFPNGI